MALLEAQGDISLERLRRVCFLWTILESVSRSVPFDLVQTDSALHSRHTWLVYTTGFAGLPGLSKNKCRGSVKMQRFVQTISAVSHGEVCMPDLPTCLCMSVI